MPEAIDDASTTRTMDSFRSELQRLRANRDARGAGSPDRYDGIELGPASTYEAVTRQMVESLANDLREIKSRLNNLLFMLIGGIMLEIAIRLIAP